MRTYQQWLERFLANDLCDFTLTDEGVQWLKLRSLERRELLAAFVAQAKIDVDLKSPDRMQTIWRTVGSDASVLRSLDAFLMAWQRQENGRIDSKLEVIRSNLYRMTEFHWGGDFRNSLDKAIVKRFVKTDEIIPFDQLEKITRGELREMSRGYLLNSWYNYWSAVLIENIFRRQAKVMPAPGKIKNVDFFVDGVPFDLKVTYIPREYAACRMKELAIVDPCKCLKQFAKSHGIPFAKDGDAEQQRYEIEQRIQDSGNVEGVEFLASIRSDWHRLIQDVKEHSRELVRWLYENQGDMRFGAENRIFLVLVDKDDDRASWKLKRNVDKLEPGIQNWIESFHRGDVTSIETKFSFRGRIYRTFADVIFVLT